MNFCDGGCQDMRYVGSRDTHFERDRLAGDALQETRNRPQQRLSLLPVILPTDLEQTRRNTVLLMCDTSVSRQASKFVQVIVALTV